MQSIERREKYYLVDRKRWVVVEEFDNFADLLIGLKYYAWRKRYSSGWYWSGDDETWWEKKKNYLDVGHNRNDDCQYVVFDIDWRILHRDYLHKEVEKLGEPNYRYWRWRRRKSRRKFYRYCYEENYLGFRNGPVPHAGNYRGGSRSTPRLRNEVLADLGTDREYLRLKRASEVKAALIDWDNYHWRRKKCWKDATKKRKQWM